MHRLLLQNLLERYAPSDEHQINAKNKILEFIKDNPDCFERSLLHGHITASAWLLNKDLSKALLMHHAKLDFWCQLGGHCDGEANVLNVAIKEAQEESGINNIVPVSNEIFDVDIHPIAQINNIPAHYHYDIRFLLKVDSNEKVVGNNESKAIAWFGKQIELIPNQHESMLRMFRKWCALNAYA